MNTGSVQSAVLASLVFMACSDGDIQWTGTVADSAGITIVHNPAEGAWTENSGWGVEEELRIGMADGDPDYMFGSIGGIAVSSSNLIYVFDSQASLIRAYDQQGVLQLSFGSAGAGPGQFSPQAGPILLGAGDTLLIPDMGTQRVNRFTASGEDAGTYRIAIQDGIPVRWQENESGEIVNQVRPVSFDASEPTDTLDLVAVRNADGVAIDSLIQFRSGESFSFTGGAPKFKFFPPEPMWWLAGNGALWHGINDEYRIGLYENATLTRIITKPFERPPVTEDDKDAMLTAMRAFMENLGVPAQAWPIIRQGISFTEYYPAYAQFRSGPNGSLLVQHLLRLSDLSEDELKDINPQVGFGSSDWDVFDSQGRFLGELTMPDRFQAIRFVANNVYGVWRDDLDVQYVMKLRITGLPGADTGGIPIAE